MSSIRRRHCRAATVRLLDLLHRFPPDVLERICKSLPQKFFSGCFLQLPKSSVLRRVADMLFRDLYFVLLPRAQHWQDITLWEQQGINILRGPVACDNFLGSLTEVHPHRVILAVRGDFRLLEGLLDAHCQWFKQRDEVEVMMSDCDLTDANLQVLEVFSHNLVKVSLERIDFHCLRYFTNYGWTRFPKLASWINIRGFKGKWASITPHHTALKSSSSNAKLQLEWNCTDIGLLAFPASLTELHAEFCNSPTLVRVPGLRVLLFTCNSIDTLDLDKLSPTLTKLDLSRNVIFRINGCSLPMLIETLDLSHNPLDPIDLGRISFHGWPPGLRVLRLDHVPLESLSCVYNTPRCLEVLTIGESTVQSLDLSLLPCLLELRIYSTLIPWESVAFPASVERLVINLCKVTSLECFKFPTQLMKLDLSENCISNLNTYPDWHSLVNLTELELRDNEIALGRWMPPPNLQVLDLTRNEIDAFECDLLKAGNQFIKLRHLDLTCTNLTDLSAVTFPRLLVSLVLDQNHVISLPSLANVRHLSLREGWKKEFLFEPQVSSLQTIDFTYNHIKPLCPRFFQSMSNLHLKLLGSQKRLNRLCVVAPLAEGDRNKCEAFSRTHTRSRTLHPWALKLKYARNIHLTIVSTTTSIQATGCKMRL